MNKFIKLQRVCVPLGVACNLHCKYCYRELNKPKIPAFNDLMREFLATLDPNETEAVVTSGGEPFLYMDRVKELFKYANPKIHKKIMTSGTYLTQEYVDWINEEKIELHLSHDGSMTELLRGVNIFDDPKILALVKQVKILRINSVITKYNNDCWAVYNYMLRKLKRDDFRFTPNVVYSPGNESLIDGFDMNLYAETWLRVYEETPRIWAFNRPKRERPCLGIDVLPNGDLVDIGYLHKYGTVLDSYEDVKKRVLETDRSKSVEFCLSRDCKVRDKCQNFITIASPFNCKMLETIHAYSAKERN